MTNINAGTFDCESPRHAKAYLNRGVVRDQAGDGGRSVSDFTQAIELDRRIQEAWTGRCRGKRALIR